MSVHSSARPLADAPYLLALLYLIAVLAPLDIHAMQSILEGIAMERGI